MQQLIQLLTESPGTIVYHLVTLLAIQATLGITLWQWRRNRADDFARRLSWAAGGILFSRFLIVLGVLATNTDTSTALNTSPVNAVTILPPLEQAVDSITAVFLVWALSPHSSRLPRLGDVLLAIALLVVAVMYIFFAQSWADRIAEGPVAGGYNGTEQATIWGIFQLAILGAGTLLVLAGRQRDWLLRFSIIGLLTIGHVVHFWNYPEVVATNTDIAYWVRLGNLAAFPLLAVLAYRHNLAELLAGDRDRDRDREARQFARFLNLSRDVIESRELQRTSRTALSLVREVVDAEFIALATSSPDNPQHLHLTTDHRPLTTLNEGERPQNWGLNLDDWPSFRLAMQQRQTVELRPNGLGARQLHDLYQELGLSGLGGLLVQPLLVDETEGALREAPVLGVLLLARAKEREGWPAERQAMVANVAAYVAQAIYNAQHFEKQERDLGAVAGLPTELPADRQSPNLPIPQSPKGGQVIALEQERDRALAELENSTMRLRHAEAQTAAAQQQARDLAATIEEMERLNRDDRVAALEADIRELRQALIEAEEAMAMASASESGLSPEWVMLTITRYSGELEEAQERIQQLERELAHHREAAANEVIISLAQELRTPLTSIAGYSDFLLSETMGILGTKQMSLLRRIKANVEHMEALVEQIIQLTMSIDQPRMVQVEPVDVRETVEAAINGVIEQIRKKNLCLDLDIADDLPPVLADKDGFYQIVSNLLNNACLASAENSHVKISVHTDSLVETGMAHEVERFSKSLQEPSTFLHLAVSDTGGGISPEHRFQVFKVDHFTEEPTIAGLGDARGGLSAARSLVIAHGGRIWVDSITDVGSTFTVLLPVSANGADARKVVNAA